jgi:hypothetical protein
MRNLRRAIIYLRSGSFRLLAEAVVRRLFSNDTHVGLRLPTATEFRTPRPALSLELRPIEAKDWEIFEADFSARDEDARDMMNALLLYRAGVETCVVAVMNGGQPGYMQFVIGPSENAKLEDVYGDLIPPLADGEEFLEGAYSARKYRGRGLMLHVIPLLAEEAQARGVHSFVSYPSVGDLPILRACKWCGFVPFVVRRESYRFFRRRVRFMPLPEGSPYPFEDGASELYDRGS